MSRSLGHLPPESVVDTPDKEIGLGTRSAEQIVTAIQTGTTSDG